MSSDSAAAVAGTLGLTSPFWLTLFDPTYKAVVAAMGFVLLVLTIRNKWLDLKIKAATLRKMAEQVAEIKETLECLPVAELAVGIQEIKEVVTDGEKSQTQSPQRTHHPDRGK